MIDIKHAIANLRQRQDELLDAATNVSPVLSGMPHGGCVEDKFANYSAQVDELSMKILQRTIELENLRQLADKEIELLPTAQQQKVMRFRYVEGMSMKRIARMMHYSLDAVYKVEKQAFKSLGL